MKARRLLAAVLAQQAVSAGVPNWWWILQSKLLALHVAGSAATGAISVKVAALTEGVIKAMLFTKLKVAISVVLILGFMATRGTILTCRTEAGQYCTRNGPLGFGINARDLRPRDFTTRDGDGRTLYLWKRAQSAAKAPTGSDERSAVELPWGDAVEDVQARLRPKKVNWQAKETPVFQLELRSQGKRSWKGVATQHYCELQVDGKWYKYGANFPGAPLTALKPGMHADHWLEVSLASQWYKVANEKEKSAEEDKPRRKRRTDPLVSRQAFDSAW